MIDRIGFLVSLLAQGAVPTFLIMVLPVLFVWFAAIAIGHASAVTWRSRFHVLLYCLLLGLGDRFLAWGLLKGASFSALWFVINTGCIMALALIVFQAARARKMITQYPWLYERTSPFTWRERSGAG